MENEETKVMIGLEIHAYLDTKSKLFCSCPTNVNESKPNSLCCPVCLGHPGSKPVLNEKAVELGTKVGLALNCKINQDFFFSRKTYFYPDMSANYQITQYEIPLAGKGFVELGDKKITIRRAHLEIDPAALIHPSGMGQSNYVLIDYNRSGLPLIEIVTEPDLTTPDEAREFLITLENILSYLLVLKPETTLKADCNISINGGNRVEIKNISGFANAKKALTYEIKRQINETKLGKTIEQHTRAYNQETNTTIPLRKKETEEDYGYIFDPDLVKVNLTDEYLNKIKSSMPELPKEKIVRFIKEYNLSEYDAKVLCSDFELSNLFETIVKKGASPKITNQILTREFLSILNHDSLNFNQVKINETDIFDLVKLIESEKVSDKNVKESMINYISGDKTSPKSYLEKNNLLVDTTIDLDSIVISVIDANPKAKEDYKNGNEKTLNFLAGQIMRQTKGSAQIDKVLEKLKEKIN
ncbi:MAG: Asp-tRNA(Asn)/Glu-tRNA(Gln) amidotransferase subunit GatB [Candidatus ainarchaeum sp.]|nr:Asp-tRNA(Asn)/Glu-tRNA(Gln) amidotransferase subunit GatB [Candidatus ainarchaeum sp.]